MAEDQNFGAAGDLFNKFVGLFKPPPMELPPAGKYAVAPAVNASATNTGSSAPPTYEATKNKKVGPKSSEDMLMELLTELMKPFDPEDPYAKSILSNARQSTLTSANNSGIYGPYSQNMAEQAYIKGAAGLQQQRLGMALGGLQSQRDFDYGKAKDKYQNDMDLWKLQGDQNSDFWRTVGGGLGAGIGFLGGGLAGGAASGGAFAIPGALAGASAGWGAGQNIGGAAAQGLGLGGSPMPQWNPRGN